MSKQEEIREGLIELARLAILNQDPPSRLAKEIIEYLHSEGCVLKVERELPSYRNAVNKSYNDYMLGREDMLKAGYVAVEPLIENRNDP